MADRKSSETEVRNIQKSKGSYYITIPIDYVRRLGWKERQKVRVLQEGRKLVVRDWNA